MHVARRQGALRLDQLGRLHHPWLCDLGKELRRVGHLGGSTKGAGLAVDPFEEAAHDLLAFFHQPEHVAAESLRVSNPVGAQVDLRRNGLVGLGGKFLHMCSR